MQAKELVAKQQPAVTAKWRGESERLWKAYSGITTPHLAVSSDSMELNYTRAVVDLLLHVLVPPPHLETRTGRFVVGELITCNVILPLIAKLSDPDWLNVLMVEIFGKPQELMMSPSPPPPPLPPPAPAPPAEAEPVPPQETTQVPQRLPEAPPPGVEPEAGQEAETPDLAAYEVFESEEVDCPQNNGEEEETTRPFLEHYIRAGKSNPFYQENDSDLDSPLADYKQSSTDSLVLIGQEDQGLYDRRKDCVVSVVTSNGVDTEDVQADPDHHPNGFSRSAEAPPTISSLQELEREGGSPTVNPSRELVLGVEQPGPGNPNELTVVSPLPGSTPMPAFSFEPLSSPDGPVIIQNLRITGTITAKEHRGTGSHPYTLYTIKVRVRMRS